MTDAELDAHIKAGVVERERRRLILSGKTEQERLVAAYAEAMEMEEPRNIADIEITDAVGPGGRIVDAGGVVWVNQSGAWLSPHVAGPDTYPMGWRNATPPASAEPWTVGETVKTDDLREFEDIVYRCITGHTTQAGWTPPVVPALWSIA